MGRPYEVISAESLSRHFGTDPRYHDDGWYWKDANYEDEGFVGPFKSREEADTNAMNLHSPEYAKELEARIERAKAAWLNGDEDDALKRGVSMFYALRGEDSDG